MATGEEAGMKKKHKPKRIFAVRRKYKPELSPTVVTDLFATTDLVTGKTVIGRPCPGSDTEYECLAVLVSAYGESDGPIYQTWRRYDGLIFHRRLVAGGGQPLVDV